MSNKVSKWSILQTIGLFETLIITEADTGWIVIWDRPNIMDLYNHATLLRDIVYG